MARRAYNTGQPSSLVAQPQTQQAPNPTITQTVAPAAPGTAAPKTTGNSGSSVDVMNAIQTTATPATAAAPGTAATSTSSRSGSGRRVDASTSRWPDTGSTRPGSNPAAPQSPQTQPQATSGYQPDRGSRGNRPGSTPTPTPTPTPGGTPTPTPTPTPGTTPTPTPAAPGTAAAPSVYGNSGNSVADRVTALLAKDNPLMQRAAQEGLNAGNKRGLLNSSIATGAAIGAMIDRIVPIASQDSQQGYGQMLQEMINVHQKALQTLENASQEKIASSGNSSSEKIASGNNKTAKEIADANAKAEADRLAAQLAAQKELEAARIAAEKELAATNNAAAKEMEAMRLEFQSLANAQSLNAQDKANLTNALNTAASTYAQTQSAIFGNPEMNATARTSALAAAKQAYMAQIAQIEQQFGVSLGVGTAPSGTTPVAAGQTPLPAAKTTATPTPTPAPAAAAPTTTVDWAALSGVNAASGAPGTGGGAPTTDDYVAAAQAAIAAARLGF